MEPNLKEIYERVGEAIGSSKNKDIANALGLSPTNTSNTKTRKSIPYEQLVNFALKMELSLDWLIMGAKKTVGLFNDAGAAKIKELEKTIKDLQAQIIALTEKNEKLISDYIEAVKETKNLAVNFTMGNRQTLKKAVG